MNELKLPPVPQGIETKIICAKDSTPLLEMVKIPAGEFLMGAHKDDESAYDDEKPQRCIYLKDYWISRTSVTNWMWYKFLVESGYKPKNDERNENYLKCWLGYTPNYTTYNRPIIYINRFNALAFCDFYGLNLPSEAQWEKAARGTDGRRYPWGNRKPTPKLYNFCGISVQVGQFPRGMSPYGLLDCIGNVWEWCLDNWRNDWLETITNDNTVWKEDVQNVYTCRGHRSTENVRCTERESQFDRFCSGSISFRPIQDC